MISTAFSSPGTKIGLLSTYGILGLVLMYLVANVALIVQWVRFRRDGVRKNVWAWVVTPVIGVLVLAIPVWGDLRPGQPAPSSYLPWLTRGLIAAGIIYMLVLKAMRPRVIQHAAALLEGTRRPWRAETGEGNPRRRTCGQAPPAGGEAAARSQSPGSSAWSCSPAGASTGCLMAGTTDVSAALAAASAWRFSCRSSALAAAAASLSLIARTCLAWERALITRSAA